MTSLHVLPPVPPAPHEVAVVAAAADHVTGDGEEDGRLAPWPRRDPVIGVRSGVGEADVEDDQLRAALLPFHDALRVRVEVVTGLEVRADEEDDIGIGVVGTRPVPSHPELIAGACARGADVRVRVVAVDAPGREDALRIAVLAGAADVGHHLVLPPLHDRAADARGDVVERLVPGHARPRVVAALRGTP